MLCSDSHTLIVSSRRGRSSVGFAFDMKYTAIAMIQIKNFKGSIWENVQGITEEVLRKNGVEDHFFGPNFGRFNYSVEFSHRWAKVASNIVCIILDRLETSLRKRWKGVEICSSTILGTEVLGNSKLPSRFEQAVRAYTFVKPRHGNLLPFMEAVKVLNSQEPKHTQMKILWTHGVHWVAVLSGPCIEGILSKLDLFRDEMENDYSSTSTCISLSNKNGSFFDGKDQVNEKHKHSLKHAVVCVRQIRTGPLKLGNLEPLAPFPDLPRQVKRLGGVDTLLIFREKTLGDIMSNVRKLRGLNLNTISQTNTFLIYK